MKRAPPDDGNGGAPTSPAPTGQKWKPVASDEGCGRSGVRWVLVDEICGDGEGTDDLQSLAAPMFRDGAAIADHLFAVDASHLWSLDLAKPTGQIARSALLTGLGQPLAVAQRGSELVLAAPVRSRSLSLPGAAFDVQVVGEQAFVAMGSAGLAEIDLASAAPTLDAHEPAPDRQLHEARKRVLCASGVRANESRRSSSPAAIAGTSRAPCSASQRGATASWRSDRGAASSRRTPRDVGSRWMPRRCAWKAGRHRSAPACRSPCPRGCAVRSISALLV